MKNKSLLHLQPWNATPTATTCRAQTRAQRHVQGNPPPALGSVLKAVSAIPAMSCIMASACWRPLVTPSAISTASSMRYSQVMPSWLWTQCVCTQCAPIDLSLSLHFSLKKNFILKTASKSVNVTLPMSHAHPSLAPQCMSVKPKKECRLATQVVSFFSSSTETKTLSWRGMCHVTCAGFWRYSRNHAMKWVTAARATCLALCLWQTTWKLQPLFSCEVWVIPWLQLVIKIDLKQKLVCH